MIVTAYYYLSHPGDSPIDPTYAATAMYVERGEQGDTIDHFQDTYSFQVFTFRYVEEEFIRKGKALTCRAILIVPSLADEWMGRFLAENADTLDQWGERVGL